MVATEGLGRPFADLHPAASGRLPPVAVWFFQQFERLVCVKAACQESQKGEEGTDMAAHEPEECDLLVTKAIQSGDLDAAVALYEPNASFVASPGQLATGHAAIREVLEGFISGEATFNVDAVTAVPNADGSVAVTRAKGSSTSRGPDGKPVTTPFHSVEVVRKQPDGTWLFIIDDPTGEGLE